MPGMRVVVSRSRSSGVGNEARGAQSGKAFLAASTATKLAGNRYMWLTLVYIDVGWSLRAARGNGHGGAPSSSVRPVRIPCLNIYVALGRGKRYIDMCKARIQMRVRA